MDYDQIMSLDPMFPSRARKSACSLYSMSLRSFNSSLITFITTQAGLKREAAAWAVDRVRRYTRKNLPAVVLTDILTAFTPGQGKDRIEDRFSFPCVVAEERLQCKIHWQCELLFNHAPAIIRTLFSEDITHLNLNLMRVRVESYKEVLRALQFTITKPPNPRLFPNLQSLSLSGGTVHSDELKVQIEDLTLILVEVAKNLSNLHLPVASNKVFRNCSDMESLESLHVDRTREFNNKGLSHICHPDSCSRKTLKTLHIGVYRHKLFEKENIAEFLICMRSLKELTFLDSKRALVRADGSRSPGDKVLIYSAFKKAKRDYEPHEGPVRKKVKGNHGCHEEFNEEDIFKTSFTSMKVVDRSLKPRYLMESAKKLTKLSIDWQQELCLPPFERYKASWFSEMLRGESWANLSRQLTSLEIVFPATYTINSYSLPLEDFTKLMGNLPCLEEFRLEGAGQGGPVPLIPILGYCPHLRSLVLEKCPVHVPDNYEVVLHSCVSKSLRRFYFLGEMSSLLVHDFMMRGISTYMPHLEELEVQPATVLGYCGLRPNQVTELASLRKLQKLSIPLSIRECIMNLPEVIYILREFPSLRFLMWAESYDISKGKIAFMMSWLFNALEAENANIVLQLSYKHHPGEYTNPSAQYSDRLAIN